MRKREKTPFQLYLSLTTALDSSDGLVKLEALIKKQKYHLLGQALSEANIFFSKFNDDPKSEHQAWRNQFEFIFSECKRIKPKVLYFFLDEVSEIVSLDTPDYVWKQALEFALKQKEVPQLKHIYTHLRKATNGLNGEYVRRELISIFIDKLDITSVDDEIFLDFLRFISKKYISSEVFEIIFNILNKLPDNSVCLGESLNYIFEQYNGSYKNELILALSSKTTKSSNRLLTENELTTVKELGFVKGYLGGNYSPNLFEKDLPNGKTLFLDYRNGEYILSECENNYEDDDTTIELKKSVNLDDLISMISQDPVLA